MILPIVCGIVAIVFLAISAKNLRKGERNMRLVHEINMGYWDKELADGTFNEVSKHSKKRTAVEGVNQND